MRHLVPIVLLAATVAPALPGCAASQRQSSPLRAVSEIASIEGEWVLVAIDSAEIDPAASEVRRAPTLTVADNGAAAGFSGVNRFSGRIRLDETGGVSFGPVASTKMAGPPGAMAVERAYFFAMQRVDKARMSDARLVFLAGGDETLSFRRAR